MALMTDIIKKYEAQANKRIIEAREKREAKQQEDGKELLDGVIINQGCGNVVPPADPDHAKRSIFKAPTNEELYEKNEQERSQRSDTTVYEQQAPAQQAQVQQSDYEPASQHLLRQIDELKRENRRLREQLAQGANGQ